VLLAACREFELDQAVFTDLWRVRNGEQKLKGRELEALFTRYFNEIKKLCVTVNNWEVAGR
jgi:hypothetical protein